MLSTLATLYLVLLTNTGTAAMPNYTTSTIAQQQFPPGPNHRGGMTLCLSTLRHQAYGSTGTVAHGASPTTIVGAYCSPQ